MATQTALQLNQMRDQVRRLLQLQPLYDTSGNTGDWGNPIAGQPDPNNILINQVLNEAIDAINRVVRLGKVTVLPGVSVSGVASYQYGPYYVDYSGVVADPNSISETINVVWVNAGTGKVIRLEPYGYYAPSRRYMPFNQYAPLPNPVQWQDAGTQIMLLPPPSQAGTLYLTQQEGLVHLVNDTDTIGYLPVNYHPTVWYLATAILSARAALDVEANDRFAKFYQLGASGLQQLYAWKNGWEEGSSDAIADTLRMIPGVQQALMAGRPLATPGTQTSDVRQGGQ
jgi:hypothetical protein